MLILHLSSAGHLAGKTKTWGRWQKRNNILKSLIIHQVKTKKIIFYFSVYFLHVVVSFFDWEDISNTQVFRWLSKHVKFRQKYSAACRIFNSILCVWISRWNTASRVWYKITSIHWQEDSWPNWRNLIYIDLF